MSIFGERERAPLNTPEASDTVFISCWRSAEQHGCPSVQYDYFTEGSKHIRKIYIQIHIQYDSYDVMTADASFLFPVAFWRFKLSTQLCHLILFVIWSFNRSPAMYKIEMRSCCCQLLLLFWHCFITVSPFIVITYPLYKTSVNTPQHRVQNCANLLCSQNTV